MYSPVFLSRPTTSGSPPVLSISLSNHSFSILASSFAWTLAHSRPLWRFVFFSKRTFNALSSSSRCCRDNCFLLLVMCFILFLYASRADRGYLLLRLRHLLGSLFTCATRAYFMVNVLIVAFGLFQSRKHFPGPATMTCGQTFVSTFRNKFLQKDPPYKRLSLRVKLAAFRRKFITLFYHSLL